MTTADELRTMTYDQLRDWWVQQPENGGYKRLPGREWSDQNGVPVYDAYDMPIDHPLDDTLDAIAAMLPEGWVWGRWGDGVWVVQKSGVGKRPMLEVVDTGNEKHDRLLLACLASRGVEVKDG